MVIKKNLYCCLFCLLFYFGEAQNIQQHAQFNGRYDYVAIGNTLNREANPPSAFGCEILTQSSATLSLNAGQDIVAAYLFWAGSGPGDFSVELNNVPIVASETYSTVFNNVNQPFFGAFTDVTSQVIATGNGNYTLSGLDITKDIGAYCANGVNFGGWAIIIVYEESSLPFNQVSVYKGFKAVYTSSPLLQIQLLDINVVDTQGAKIGFLAWEGDEGTEVNESLRVNNIVLSDPPLNPANNPFNSTNAFTGSTSLWNMDLDFYSIENEINVGDTSLDITITSGQDEVIVHNIVVVLNSELPDATIEINKVVFDCGSRDFIVDYTVFNTNGTKFLPANTPIAFYAQGTLIGTSATISDIPIDGSEPNSVNLTLPASIPDNFILTAVVNDIGNGTGNVAEYNEDNNEFSLDVAFPQIPQAGNVMPIIMCDTNADGQASFYLPLAEPQLLGSQTDISITYHETLNDADANSNAIADPTSYVNSSTPFQTIYVRLSSNNSNCYVTSSFDIEVRDVNPIPFDLMDLNMCVSGNSDLGFSFDLTIQENLIFGNTSSNDYTVSYHESQLDAAAGNNPISAPQDYQNIENPQTIWVRLENNVVNCVETGFFEIRVNLNPAVTPPAEISDYVQCDSENRPGFAQFNLITKISEITQVGPNISFSFHETREDAENRVNALPQNGYTNLVSPQTIYVRVYNNSTGCLSITNFSLVVVNSNPPLELFSVVAVNGAFAGNHVIVASVATDDVYYFQLDGGPIQEIGRFENVTKGVHFITFRDEFGCVNIRLPVTIIGYPLYFTPNNDGFNDTWNIKELASNPTARIFIYDRYGKLITDILPKRAGWDGNYQGRPLPSNDYWFLVEYEEDGIQKVFRGHFTLKR